MQSHELTIELEILEARIGAFEAKYGRSSGEFYTALLSGELAKFDELDQTREDFSRWKGVYETWARRSRRIKL